MGTPGLTTRAALVLRAMPRDAEMLLIRIRAAMRRGDDDGARRSQALRCRPASGSVSGSGSSPSLTRTASASAPVRS